jgi:hypothetical protein
MLDPAICGILDKAVVQISALAGRAASKNDLLKDGKGTNRLANSCCVAALLPRRKQSP